MEKLVYWPRGEGGKEIVDGRGLLHFLILAAG